MTFEEWIEEMKRINHVDYFPQSEISFAEAAWDRATERAAKIADKHIDIIGALHGAEPINIIIAAEIRKGE